MNQRVPGRVRAVAGWAAMLLTLAQPAQADGPALYYQVLARVEQMLPEVADETERARLLAALVPLAAAYAARHPAAPPPRLRLVGGNRFADVAKSLDSGLILVDPQRSARLSGQAMAGMLAHELAHVALGHGWARVRTAYGQIPGERPQRLALAMTGRHPLKGSQAWSDLLFEQEYQADREGRRLLVLAGLPADGLDEAIRTACNAQATASHPGGGERLAALAPY